MRFSPRTRDNYQHNLKHVRLAGFDPSTMTTDEWFEYSGSKPWQTNTTRQVLSTLRSLQRFEHGDDFPLKPVKVGKQEQSPQLTITLDDIENVLASLDLSEPAQFQYSLIFKFFWSSWLRLEELCNLRAEHVDLDTGIVNVKGKGGEWETCAISNEMCRELKAWGRPPTKTLFANSKTGKPFTPSGLRANIRRISQRSGVRISAHAIRRGALCHAILNGLHPRLCQIQGRWKSIAMIERYSRALDLKGVRNYLNGGAS